MKILLFLFLPFITMAQVNPTMPKSTLLTYHFTNFEAQDHTSNEASIDVYITEDFIILGDGYQLVEYQMLSWYFTEDNQTAVFVTKGEGGSNFTWTLSTRSSPTLKISTGLAFW